MNKVYQNSNKEMEQVGIEIGGNGNLLMGWDVQGYINYLDNVSYSVYKVNDKFYSISNDGHGYYKWNLNKEHQGSSLYYSSNIIQGHTKKELIMHLERMI